MHYALVTGVIEIERVGCRSIKESGRARGTTINRTEDGARSLSELVEREVSELNAYTFSRSGKRHACHINNAALRRMTDPGRGVLVVEA